MTGRDPDVCSAGLAVLVSAIAAVPFAIASEMGGGGCMEVDGMAGVEVVVTDVGAGEGAETVGAVVVVEGDVEI